MNPDFQLPVSEIPMAPNTSFQYDRIIGRCKDIFLSASGVLKRKVHKK